MSNIVYTFNDTNLAKVDAVEFDLSASADNVKVQLTTSAGVPSGTVYDCALRHGQRGRRLAQRELDASRV